VSKLAQSSRRASLEQSRVRVGRTSTEDLEQRPGAGRSRRLTRQGALRTQPAAPGVAAPSKGDGGRRALGKVSFCPAGRFTRNRHRYL